MVLALLVLSCGSGPQQTESARAQPSSNTARNTGRAVFNPAQVSAEVHRTTMIELRSFIESLNTIIRSEDYSAWTSYLSPSFFTEINSSAFLSRITEELFRRDQIVASNTGKDPRQVKRRVLNNSMDFFYNVVIPSRSNDRLDDITFVSENRVTAYTLDTRGNRLILYDLEKIDNQWKITN